jgi:hypothetical protein
VAGLIFVSKPDRGGLYRCQEIFGFDLINQKDLKNFSFSTWSPFENPKFRMKIGQSKFQELKLYLYYHGYKEWKEGGLQYGSLNMGWDGSAPLIYSFKKFHGHVHIVAYDEKNQLFYAIVSQ